MLVLVLISVSVVLLFLYDRYNRAGRLLYKIPGPKRLPFIGNALHFMLSPSELFPFMRTIYKTYGGFSQIHAFQFRSVNLYNPDDIKVVLSSVRYIEKQIPYIFLKPWLSDGLLTSFGFKWHHRRKLLTQAFHFNIIKKYARTFTEQTEEFLKNVQTEVGNSRTDILPLISSVTLRIMCETAMGTSMNVGIESVMNKYFKAIELFGEVLVQRICRPWLYFDVLFKLTNIEREQNKALQELHKFTNKIINERKASFKETNMLQVVENAEGNYDNIDDDNPKTKGKLAMLDLLLENEKLGNINVEGIREEVDTFLFEGHDTTAMAISFLIMAIANESAVQQKIYEEMENIFGCSKRSATIHDLNQMAYLECCIKESLRLYPSVPFISRYITEELTISGYTVPANTHYQILIYDVHRRADLYPEPERFIPERFLPENSVKRHPYAYLPFSAGPRNCIGQKFAMIEIKNLVSSLIRRFRLQPITKPSDLKFQSDIVLRTHKQPIYVRFDNRESKQN